jgi:hypothetical protein
MQDYQAQGPRNGYLREPQAQAKARVSFSLSCTVPEKGMYGIIIKTP